ncbi:MAG: patatin-like phospholipase family protein [Bacillota bacterium]|nr:patatin-like phospholipase family protein [Bacillota bacterium]
MSRGKVAIVLGAGSARGIAHVGVLQVLKEEGIDFDFIVGSSMGAMIGGIYACGADLYMLEKMWRNMDSRLLMDVNVPRMGFLAGKRVKSFLELLCKNRDFEQLDVPLLAVATDLVSGQRVVIEEGRVADAIRASISIPGVFKPIRKEGMVLVDGAVCDRLPVEVARERGADIVIAVDVTFGPGKEVSIHNTLDVIMTSLDIMQKQQFDLIYPKVDILIQPAVGHLASRDFDRSQEAIEMGRQATQEKIKEIRGKISLL